MSPISRGPISASSRKRKRVPIQPTAHYAMGGLPTNIEGQVLQNELGDVDSRALLCWRDPPASQCTAPIGLAPTRWSIWSSSAAAPGGTCSSTSRQPSWLPLPAEPELATNAEVSGILGRAKGESIADIRERMQVMMMDKVSVVRNREGLTEAQQGLVQLRDAYTHAAIQDKGSMFNTDLMEALELGYMLDCAEAIVGGALAPRGEPGRALSHRLRSPRRQELARPHACVRKTSGGLAYDEEAGLDHQISAERAEVLATRAPMEGIVAAGHRYASSDTTRKSTSSRISRSTSSRSSRPTACSMP